ncbi:hypothetical protein niasHT_034583 [Heterodera trifolii]|uniref:Uncharacterized protein n=1 Tax=Heterodera trifolii TaxID=157864 RepID=A0ABD2IRU9_9BILA
MEQKIILNLENSRHFQNPFLTNVADSSRYVSRDWILQKLNELAQRIVKRRIATSEYEDDGPYVGPSGIAYALVRAMRRIGQNQSNFGESIRTILAAQNDFLNHQTKMKSDPHKCRYLTGTLGFLTVQAVAEFHLSKGADIASLSAHFRNLLPIVLRPGYQQIGDDEMLNGRAGFLASLLELRLLFGQQLLSDNEIRSVLDAMVSSGRKYSKKHKSPAKLMFEWYNTEYLGAAHGVSGIYQMMLSFWDLLDASAKSDLKQSVDWLLSTQFSDGNFPSSSDRIGLSEELVHWCHGASGVLHLLIVASLVFKEGKHLESAERCANLIWARGILRKGPGICHGVAGNGYAFLLLFRLTKNDKFLQMAHWFAFIMMAPSFEASARVPDCPWSLFEGWAGALCFLADLLEPTTAQFPLLPIPFN